MGARTSSYGDDGEDEEGAGDGHGWQGGAAQENLWCEPWGPWVPCSLLSCLLARNVTPAQFLRGAPNNGGTAATSPGA